MVVEAASPDAPAIGAFLREVWQQAGPGSLGFTGASDDVIAAISTTDAIVARIDPPHRRIFVAQLGDRVVGFAATRRVDAATVELAGITVAEGLTGKGLGGLLLEGAIEAARRDAHREMIVRTEAENERALGFYRRHEFKTIETVVDSVEGEAVEVCALRRDL